MRKMSNIKKYVITTYLVFWVMVLGICGMASMVFHAPPLVMRILSNICAWSPTIVLFALFKKLVPDMTVGEFLKKCFTGNINVAKLVIGCAVTVECVVLSAFVSSLVTGNGFNLYFQPITLSSLPLSVILSLTSGPTGEELGWRGYLKGELEEKYGFLNSAVYLGIIWAFWHTVLWFVDADFKGAEFIIYVISNVVVMTSLNIIMSVVMDKGNNVFCSVVIHFCFNFTYLSIKADIVFYICLTVIFALAAIVFLAQGKEARKKNINEA